MEVTNHMESHNLDEFPIPKEKLPIFINEPLLIDRSLEWITETRHIAEPLTDEDNIRVYIPMDISKESILRRLDWIIQKYGEVSFWKNESDFSCDVYNLVLQIEIYDQYWLSYGVPYDGKHCEKTIELVKAFVVKLKDNDEGDGEMFPHDVIEELEQEYLHS